MEHHNQREYLEEESSEGFVFCLSIDLIGSTAAGLKLPSPELRRFNISLVNQIRPHLKKLELTDSLVKFTGDGWLVTAHAEKVRALCCFAIIMANDFQKEMHEKSGIALERIPSLRLAICTGYDVSVELSNGHYEWVGDSARRSTRASGWCYNNEILINDSVRQIVLRDFHIEFMDPQKRLKPDKWEEDFPLYTLGDLNPEAAADSEAPEYYVITLKTIGKIEEAKELGLKASERLENKAIKPGIDEIERQNILRNWNRLMASIPDYTSARRIWMSIQAAGLMPDISTYNTLIKKAPDYDEAKALVDTMQNKGILPNVVTYSELIDKASAYDEAKALVATMKKKGIQPNVVTYSTLVKKAPDYDEAKALVDTMQNKGIPPNVVTYSELIDKAPDYDEAKALVDMMQDEGIMPNVITYNTLIKKAPGYDEVKALMDTMQKKGILPDIVTYNTLVNKTLDYDETTTWVYTMREKGIPPNVVTYSTLIKKAPNYDEATALVATMREEGTPLNIYTYNTLIKKAPNYDEATALVATMRGEGVQPNVYTYREFVDKAPDYDEAKTLVETMQGEGVQPNVYIYNTLFKKDLSGVLADDILKWYLAQKNHPEQPIQAVIASYRKIHCLDQALRLALDYPHLQAARKLIRENEAEALSYFRIISDHDPQHPNAEYALGIALMELEQELEAETHFKKALKLATAEPRQAGIKRLLRQIDGKQSHRR